MNAHSLRMADNLNAILIAVEHSSVDLRTTSIFVLAASVFLLWAASTKI